MSNAPSEIPASEPTHGATARQNEAEEDSQIEPLLPPHLQPATPQPACAPDLHRLCIDCGYQEEDWIRRVEFASLTNGEKTLATGDALFDTGAKLDNLLSLDFVTKGKIPFERWSHDKEIRLPWWKRAWSRVFEMHPQTACYTADQRPITAIGVVRNLRWRGISEPRCNTGLRFPHTSLNGDFLVIKNLAYDAVFSSKTMNDAGLRGPCHRTVAVTEQPKPTQDPDAAKRSRDAKKEQERIQKNQEKRKQGDKGKKRAGN